MPRATDTMTPIDIDATPRALRTLRKLTADHPDQDIRLTLMGYG